MILEENGKKILWLMSRSKSARPEEIVLWRGKAQDSLSKEWWQSCWNIPRNRGRTEESVVHQVKKL